MLYRQGWWLLIVDVLREPMKKLFERSEVTGRFKGLVESTILYLASSVANVVSYPWEIARIRMMVDMRQRHEKALYKNPTQCLREIWNSQGVRGWYAGLTVSLLQNILTIGLARSIMPQLTKFEQYEIVNQQIPSNIYPLIKLALSFTIA